MTYHHKIAVNASNLFVLISLHLTLLPCSLKYHRVSGT